MSKRFMIYKKTTRKNWVGNGVQVRKREERERKRGEEVGNEGREMIR